MRAPDPPSDRPGALPRNLPDDGPAPSLTLRQLEIFCAVAQAQTLTKAGKQLAMAQPSLSQQLAKLERAAGVRLFDRTNTRMVLTDAGQFLLRRALHMLGAVDEAQAGLRAFAEGARGVVRIAGLNSVLRHVLPPAMAALADAHPGIELHVHEVGPAEALELLQSRRVHIGLVATNSIPQASLGFAQVPLVTDPYVLVTPDWLDLSVVAEPAEDLEGRARQVLENCIEFNFGTRHMLQVEQWFNRMIPGHRVVARCRSYEVAIEMVRAGLGVCLAPALTARDGRGTLSGVRLWASGEADRATVAMLPAQHARVEPVRSVLAALQRAAGVLPPSRVEPAPPFIAGTP